MTIRAASMDALREAAPPVSHYRAVGFGPLSIGAVVQLQDTEILCDEVGPAYYTYLPLAGHFEVLHRGWRTTATPATAPVLTPGGGSFHARWRAGGRGLCVRLAAGAVHEAFDKLREGSPPIGANFGAVMDIERGFGRSWAQLVSIVARQGATDDALASRPLVAAPLADSMLHGFLLAATRADPDHLAPRAARPAAVRAAVDLIEASPQDALTVSQLAGHCGVGIRALQEGFRKHLGMSPMAYVRAVRLQRAHQDLRAADPSTETVAAVARRWGFGHPGRFAAAHEAHYGHSPAEALRSPV